MCIRDRGSFGDGRDWAIQVAETRDGGAGDVEAWDVGSLIDMAGGTVVDLLKIDIERAEIAVFGDTAKSWLPRIRNICIELQDVYKRQDLRGAPEGNETSRAASGI